MNKISLSTLFSLLLLSACGNGKPPKPSAQPSSESSTQNQPAPTYLEGIYATSSATGKGVENLFDADPATVWQTQPGAGPDEGVMLYFQEAVSLESVEILAVEGSFAIKSNDAILVYLNGQAAATGPPNTRINLGGKDPVKSLFIRFTSTGKEAGQDLSETVRLLSFPNQSSISIAEIKVYDAKGNPLRMAMPLQLSGRVSASSTLAPEEAYSPANLFDSRKEFAWAEGAANAGESETLVFEFDQPVDITALQIWNGYQRSDEHYAANARAREIEFGIKGGDVAVYTLKDSKAGQKIQLKAPMQGSAFELKIKSVFPGKKYKDLALSELVFYNGNQPLVLRSGLPARYQSALRAKAAPSQIAALLDRRIANVIEDEGGSIVQSLILRADGTFVLYSASESGTGMAYSAFADGNWGLISGTQLKVFGKWNEIADGMEYYEGVSEQNFTQIFSDVLTISGNKLTGTKQIGTFYWK